MSPDGQHRAHASKFGGAGHRLLQLFGTTLARWQRDKASMYGAALAYYGLFSSVPLLVIALAGAGLLFGEQAAQGELKQSLQSVLGVEGAAQIEDLVARARRPERSLVAGIAGTIVLLLAATGFFSQLQDALNTVWNVRAEASSGFRSTLRERFWSLVGALLMGLALLSLVAVSAALSAIGQWAGAMDLNLGRVWQFAGEAAAWGVTILLFAAMFKVLPETEVAWGDVWVGAAATALLFAVGKYLFGLYLRLASFDSAYGSAAGLILVLVWAYYSAQILLLGAEFTAVYSNIFGSRRRQAASRAGQNVPARS